MKEYQGYIINLKGLLSGAILQIWKHQPSSTKYWL